MSINRDYLLSFFLSLAFWISIIFVFNLSLKAKKPSNPEEIVILKAPEVIENTPTQIPKPTNQQAPKQTIKKPIEKPKSITHFQKLTKTVSKPSTNPTHTVNNNINSTSYQTQTTPISSNTPTNLPSKAPPNIPSLPTKPRENAGGDYFKNAYTPPKALYSPKPSIPQSLLPDVKELVLKVKFYIRKDGSAKAILLTPTPNPSLNALLQKELSNWKFFPATKNQMPIDSTIDMEIKIRIE